MWNKEFISILLVEDDEFYATLLQDFLVRNGFPDVHSVKNGIGCLLEVFEGNTPDVIIMDHQLGELNGLDLLKRINAGKPEVRVIFLSSYDQPDVAVKALKYGAIDYFVKDDNVFGQLGLALNRLLEDRSKRVSPGWLNAMPGQLKSLLW